MPAKRSSSQQYHDRVAAKYDAIYEREPFWLVYNEVTWTHIKRHLPTDLTIPVLDVGCGTGTWGLKLAKSGFSVTLLDNSAKMLDQARKKAASMGLTKAVSFVQDEIEELQALADEQFGLVIAQGDPLSLVSRPAKAVASLARVMRSGACAVCSVDNRWAGIDYYTKTDDLQRLRSFFKDGETNWLTEHDDERFRIHMFWPDELRALFESRGFEVLELLPKMCVVRDRDSRWFADPELRRAIVALELKAEKQSGALGRAAHLEVVVRKRSECR